MVLSFPQILSGSGSFEDADRLAPCLTHLSASGVKEGDRERGERKGERERERERETRYHVCGLGGVCVHINASVNTLKGNMSVLKAWKGPGDNTAAVKVLTHQF